MTALPIDISGASVTPTQSGSQQYGFSLVELAIVLVIVALLTSGLLLGISAQRNVAENADAQRQLENVREALLGFAMANGRLPCPADPTLTNADATVGTEDRPNANSACNRIYGVVPWVTLGLPKLIHGAGASLISRMLASLRHSRLAHRQASP